MLRNYVKIAVRNARRNPIYAGINVTGLAVSMAVCLLLITFSWEQFQYDEFHEHKDRIVRIITDEEDHSGPAVAAPAPLATVLERTAPEVEATVRLKRLAGHFVRNQQGMEADGMFVDESFFEIFSFELLRGNPATALENPLSIVLSRRTARELFGSENPIGASVRVEDAFTADTTYTVTGVLTRPSGPTHLQFDALASFSTLASIPGERNEIENWRVMSYPTYAMLGKDAGPSAINDDLSRILDTHYTEADRQEITLSAQPLGAITPGPYYSSPVPMRTVPWFVIYFLGGLGAVLLLTACFNYVGLSVARSLDRSTEIGVRKVVGARRRQVTGQFLVESVLFALLALAAAYALLPWLISLFNDLQFIGRFDGRIGSNVYHPELLLLFVLFAIATGLLAGGLPALRLSGFQPINVIKGLNGTSIRGLGSLSLRKGLVIVQFMLAVVFIISAALLYRQYDYMARNDYGMDVDQIINVQLQEIDYRTFRQELRQHPSIAGISAAGALPPDVSHSAELVREEKTFLVSQMRVGLRFVDNMGLEMVAGRSFSPAFGRDSLRSIIVNGTAVNALGFESPSDAIGASLSMDTKLGSVGTKDVDIVGVVTDFQYELPTEPIGPLVMWYGTGSFWHANVRAAPGQLAAAATAIEKAWDKLDPVHPAQYQRYEAEIAGHPMHQVFHDLTQIVGFVAILAIVIAVLGLLGMAAYSAQQRVKEVGIRKVIGASVADVTYLLSKDFLVLVAIAVTLALPVAWYANSLWLQQFARRVGFTGGVIGGSIVVVFLIALVTVGSQAVKAALTNPADSLRYE